MPPAQSPRPALTQPAEPQSPIHLVAEPPARSAADERGQPPPRAPYTPAASAHRAQRQTDIAAIAASPDRTTAGHRATIAAAHAPRGSRAPAPRKRVGAAIPRSSPS